MFGGRCGSAALVIQADTARSALLPPPVTPSVCVCVASFATIHLIYSYRYHLWLQSWYGIISIGVDNYRQALLACISSDWPVRLPCALVAFPAFTHPLF